MGTWLPWLHPTWIAAWPHPPTWAPRAGTPASDRHVAGRQPRQGIRGLAAGRAYLQVEVRGGYVPGRADPADRVAGGDRALGRHHRREVAVPDLGTVAERQHHPVAVRARPAGGGDRTGVDGVHRCAGGSVEVLAGVDVAPRVGLAEAGAEGVAGDRLEVRDGEPGEAFGLGGSRGLRFRSGLGLDGGLRGGGLLPYLHR